MPKESPMLLIKFLRFLQGYAVFEARGGFPERFVNLCTKNGIPLWNVRNSSGVLSGYTCLFSLEELFLQAQKSGMELEITKENGLRVLMKRHKKRKGLLIALGACIVLTVFLSSFIWSVSVRGNEMYSDEEILSVFEEQGVRIGAFKRKIDTKAVSDNATLKLNGLSWAKVNIRGCFAYIEVSEVRPVPDITDKSIPTNLVANSDGQIMKYEVSVGTPALKSGIAVTKGDLLVSGVIDNSDGSVRLVHSKAHITARVTHSVSGKSPVHLFSQTDENIAGCIFFFGLKLLPVKNTDGFFESRKYLESDGRLLPIGFFRYRRAEYEKEYEFTEAEMELLSLHSFNLQAMELYSSAEEILSQKISCNKAKISGKFTCEESIAREAQILTGEE